MRRHFTVLSAMLVVCLTPALTWAADGVLMVQTITGGTGITKSEVQIERNRMRTEISDGASMRQTIIYDGSRDVLLVVDTARKSYMEMTRADAERMGTMVQGAMAMMKEQMAKMPPAQRAAMEKQMGGLMGGVVELPTYKRNGSDRVGQWACDKYDGYSAGQKSSEVCTVDPKVLGLTMDDFAVTNRMIAFVSSMVPQMAGQLVGLGATTQGITGLPVRSTSTSAGNTMTIELTEVRRSTFSDDLFVVPAGFTKQALPTMAPR